MFWTESRKCSDWGRVLTNAILLMGPLLCNTPALAQTSDPEAVFAERLMPIFQSDDPSSCVQCHLSSVDLKEYILPSSRETFLSLRKQGLVDTDRPSESKILHLIAMGDSDTDLLAQRIHAKTRKAEYEAFAHWIEACCQDEDLLSSEIAEQQAKAGPEHSDAVIRHTRKDRVLDSFVRNVWSQRMRCFPCHTPAELDGNNPLHAKPIERHRDFVKQHGAKMNLFLESPEKTLRSLIANSRRPKGEDLPLINVEQPNQSLLLLKPTAKLPKKGADGKLLAPSSQVPVSHLGGIKIHEGDQSYKSILHWLDDYSKSKSGSYANAEELPQDNWYPTEHVVRVKNVPADWPAMSKVQIFVHVWDGDANDWGEKPIAFTQSLVTPRRIVNGPLFALPSRSEGLKSSGVTLEPARVQMRVYLDRENVLEALPTELLNSRKPDAMAVFEASFGKGFKNADVIDGLETVE